MTACAPLLRLHGVVQHYDWGSHTFLPTLLGHAATAMDTQPPAELWLGSHPRGMATVDHAGTRVPLADVLALLPDGASLGFLLKVLAADAPLSVQTHPSRAQAQAGFAREQSAGIAVDAPTRIYRDPRAKPEMLVALTPFWAMVGFRAVADIRAQFARAGLGYIAPAEGTQDLRAWFANLLNLAPADVLQQLARAPMDKTAEGHWCAELLARWPRDILCVAPLMLQLVQLQSLEAIALGPGVLHAYLSGAGVELMGNSDNVVRAGLTSKAVHVDELLHIASFAPAPTVRLTAAPIDGTMCYRSQGLQLMTTNVRTKTHHVLHAPAPSIALCTEGSLALTCGGVDLPLKPGEAACITRDTGLDVRGSGRLWIASAQEQA